MAEAREGDFGEGFYEEIDVRGAFRAALTVPTALSWSVVSVPVLSKSAAETRPAYGMRNGSVQNTCARKHEGGEQRRVARAASCGILPG